MTLRESGISGSQFAVQTGNRLMQGLVAKCLNQGLFYGLFLKRVYNERFCDQSISKRVQHWGLLCW